jgi:hypothetical protein
MEREGEIEKPNNDTKIKPLNYIGLFNTEKKKKPYDVKFKNFNPNEPKINVNMRYSDKQKYRRYKTKTEPKLFSKIMVDDEEDLIAKIRKEFGIKDTKKKNYSSPETSGTPYYPEINPIAVKQERVKLMRTENDIMKMTYKEIEDIVGGIINQIGDEEDYEEEEGEGEEEGEEGEEEDEEEEEIEDMSRGEMEDLLGAVLDTEPRTPEPRTPTPPAFERLKSGFTDATAFSTATTAVMGIEDLTLELQKRGIPLPRGRKPLTPNALKIRELYLKAQIKENDKRRGAAP